MLEKIIGSIPTDLKDGEIVTSEWKDGEKVSEKRVKTDWKPNAADLDIVLVGCECGNQYDMPWDALMFLNDENSSCGQCGKSGKMNVIADPSPNKKYFCDCTNKDCGLILNIMNPDEKCPKCGEVVEPSNE